MSFEIGIAKEGMCVRWKQTMCKKQEQRTKCIMKACMYCLALRKKENSMRPWLLVRIPFSLLAGHIRLLATITSLFQLLRCIALRCVVCTEGRREGGIWVLGGIYCTVYLASRLRYSLGCRLMMALVCIMEGSKLKGLMDCKP